jgi:pimeloyl-ACP methyl ester carboxylesterase
VPTLRARPHATPADVRAAGYLPIAVEGSGPLIVLCPGFGLSASSYAQVVHAVARDSCVVVPALFRPRGVWRLDAVLSSLTAHVDRLDDGRDGTVTLMGHSFGGGIALRWAARHPSRVRTLVLVDSLGMSSRWQLAWQALMRTRYLRLLRWGLLADFAASVASAPASIARAAWSAFSADSRADLDALARSSVPVEVVWGRDDSVLDVELGRALADRLGARFTVVGAATGGPVEHDWPIDRPDLFVATLRRLQLP